MATTATPAISMEFRRDTESASGGRGGSGRGLGSRVVGALAGGVGLRGGGGRRTGAGGGAGVAGRGGERVGDRGLLEEDDDLEAGRRALAARPDGRAAGGGAAAARGRGVG